MTINFYENSSPTSTLYPNLTALGSSIDITPFNAMSITTPEVVIDYNEAIATANYCKISWISEGMLNEMWYFCKLRTDNGGRYIVSCERDPLYSFRNAIRHCPINVVRNGGVGKPTKITDTKYPVSPVEENIDQIPVSNSSLTANGSGCYVLQVIGGATNGG